MKHLNTLASRSRMDVCFTPFFIKTFHRIKPYSGCKTFGFLSNRDRLFLKRKINLLLITVMQPKLSTLVSDLVYFVIIHFVVIFKHPYPTKLIDYWQWVRNKDVLKADLKNVLSGRVIFQMPLNVDNDAQWKRSIIMGYVEIL